MKNLLLFIALAVASAGAAEAQKSVFVMPDNGFETDIIAGMQKKAVPLSVVTTEDSADYTLKANQVTITSESTGGKIARCLFADCIGIEDKGNVSVQLIDNHTHKIVWAYNVAKQRGGSHNRQSMAEAIAKHLKSDYLDKKK